MDTWWDYSPYYFLGTYIGGNNMACSQPNESDAWQIYVTQINGAGDGWDLELFWVGDQSQCDDGSASYFIPSNTTAAFLTGASEASSAAGTAENLGFEGGVLYEDLEAYNYDNLGCLASAEYFIDGWD